MKRILFSLLLSASVTLAGSESYLAELDGLIADAKKLETAILDESIEALSTDLDIQNKISEYESKSSSFAESIARDITDTDLAKQMLDSIEILSQNTLSLANSIVDLADKTSTNTNDSYLMTLETLTQTTLRLSDDIGEMANRIGEMADRIVYTEELISKNAQMINDSMLTIIDKFDFQQPTQHSKLNTMPNSTPNISMPTPPAMPGRPF